MYRGSHPTSPANRRPCPPPIAMLASPHHRPTDMNPPPQPIASYSPYHGPPQWSTVAPSRPEVVPPPQYHRPHDQARSQSNAQQLPSLRTLLEPELIHGNKLLEHRPRAGAAHLARNSNGRYASSSPTLKRRHDFDGYSYDYPDSNAVSTQPPHIHRHAHHPSTSDPRLVAFPKTGSMQESYPSDFSHPASLGRSLQHDSAGSTYRLQSATLSTGASSVAVGPLSGPMPTPTPQDDPMDTTKSIRRRTEGLSRAPIRATRCVGQREVQGEGLCYVYEDGTFCRAIIDGEPVNPSWGITKAGKPRKRLAQACLTCREKKIKCEPGYPTCHQCAKSQRMCRGGLSQQGKSDASGATSPSSSSTVFKSQSTELVSPVTGPERSKAIDEHREPTRTIDAKNTGSPCRPQNARLDSAATSRDMSVHSLESDWNGFFNNADPVDSRCRAHHDQLALQWEQDPYETHAGLTMHLLNLYFLHTGRATYGIFPQKPFTTWVKSNHEKTQDYLMLLYSVLAMGSVFSPDPDTRSIGNRFAAIAAHGAEKRYGRFTLQLCQSRLILALYNFSRGKAQEAWDFCGAGLRAISALKLNTEKGVKELPDTSAELDYGFDRGTLEECCRRTFWSGFLMDRYNGFCGGTLCVINLEDVFVRLPCLESVYEACNACDTPFFDFDILSRQAPPSPPLGHMAYLTLISAIWGEVLTFTGRAVHRPDKGYEQLYEAFYAKIYERLDAWRSMLPDNLRYTRQNLDNSIIEGYEGTFISLYALYYAAVIRLNRHVRIRLLPAEKIARNIDHSFRNASEFLSIMQSLAAVNLEKRLPPNAAANFLFAIPFPGYALMLSIDVLTAAGTISALPELIKTLGTTLPGIEELSTSWASARQQLKAVSNRAANLAEIAFQEQQGVRDENHGQFWRVSNSMETAFGSEDAVYKASDQLLFEVVGALTRRSALVMAA